jgi:hypothetical protein
VKLDTHVHTTYSGQSSIHLIRTLVRESHNTPEGVYSTAKARGMDLVTITDHDVLAGAMALADRSDVIAGHMIERREDAFGAEISEQLAHIVPKPVDFPMLILGDTQDVEVHLHIPPGRTTVTSACGPPSCRSHPMRNR